MKVEVRDRIIELSKQSGGVISPDDIIADAKNPDSPLHTQFNWDIEQAAHEHWRDTARSLIRAVRVERVIEERNIQAIAYVRDPTKPYLEQGYIETALLSDDTDRARASLLYEFGRAESSLNRAFDVASSLGLDDDVAALLKGIGFVRAKAKAG